MGKRDAGGFRRRHLLLGAAGVLPPLAGCESWSGSTQPDDIVEQPRPCRVTIENRDSEPHTVSVLIERGPEIVHWTEREVAAGDPSQDPIHAEFTSYDVSQFRSEPGDYVVSATYDDRAEWDRKRLTEVESHSKCVEVDVLILASGRLVISALL